MTSFEQLAVPREGVLAFADAYARLFQESYRIAYRLVGDRMEAEDIAAETCARAYSRWSSINEYAEPWCVRVAGNLGLDLLRARARRSKRIERELVARHDIETIDRLDLYDALSTLPRRQRETVILRYLSDQSEEQTAALLGLSVGSVKTHASRGVAHLRKVMQR